jgi:hypothetical protein
VEDILYGEKEEGQEEKGGSKKEDRPQSPGPGALQAENRETENR